MSTPDLSGVAVFAEDMGGDPNVLYVDAARFPTRLGAVRAANGSVWGREYGMRYRPRDAEWLTGPRMVDCHKHGDDEGDCEDGVGPRCWPRLCWTLDGEEKPS